MINTFNAPDVADISGFSAEENEQFVEMRRAYGVRVDRGWGLNYQATADGIMLDNRPDYARYFYEGLRTFRTRLEPTNTEFNNPVQLTITSFQHLPMYILYGWETGIYNEFRHLQSRGLSKAQLMELVMFAQLQAGMRGLQLVYNAVGKYLPDWRESVQFALEFHPEFYKWHRARWEVIFQKLPKQTAPYVMIRQHMLTNNREALREAVLLGRAWGITREWMALAFATTAYYTGFEALYAAYDAVHDILQSMS